MVVGKILTTYDNQNHNNQSMSLRISILILALAWLSACDNILLILDNTQLQKTHSKLISMLSSVHKLDIGYSFGKSKIELKNYDRFKYDHVIVMCLSAKETTSQIKVNDIVSYFDDGGNVIIVGDIDTDKSFRKLFYAFGVELDEYGSKLKDYFNNNGNEDILKSGNYVNSPFMKLSQPVLYQGTGLNLVNYVNYQLYELISSESTALSRNYIKEQTQTIGRKSLVVGVQGLNNARAVLAGSLFFFSDEAFETQNFDNENAVKDLLSWAFGVNGVLKVSNMFYHGEGAQSKETLFNVGEKIYYKVDVEAKQLNNWVPFVSDDLQVEFVMLDPWVRIPLKNIAGTPTYQASFYAPSKEGIYQFKIIYKKPGYTFLTYSERVTLRPYKHDEYERFLLVAFPYQFGMISTIVGTFVFLIFYLYSSFEKSRVKED